MRTLGNILWNLLGGFIFAFVYFVIGAVLSLTVVLIPLGKPFLRLAKITLSPFGKMVDVSFASRPVANAFWIVPIGFALMLVSFAVGAVLCVTLVGIPFGIQCFKVGRVALTPYGAIVQ